MKRISTLILFFICFSLQAIAQTQLYQLDWTQTNAVADEGDVISCDQSGNSYVAGKTPTNDLFIARYNRSGTQVWQHSYSLSAAVDIQLDGNGFVYVLSVGNSTGFLSDIDSADYQLQKLDTSGVLQWTRTYDDSLHLGDVPSVMLFTASGNIVITGSVFNRYNASQTGTDIFSICYDPSGNTLWQTRYNGASDRPDIARSLSKGLSGELYLCGYESRQTVNGVVRDGLLQKYNPNTGQLVWSVTHGMTTFTEFTKIAVGLSGTIVVNELDFDGDVHLRAYSPSGNLQWQQLLNIGYENAVFYLGVDFAGDFLVSYESDSLSSEGVAVSKVSPGGSVLWTVRDFSVNILKAVCADQNGNLLVAGTDLYYPYQIIFSRFNNAGYVDSRNFYQYQSNQSTETYGICADSSGAVYVTGRIRLTYVDLLCVQRYCSSGLTIVTSPAGYICAGDPVQLAVSGASSYSWSPASSLNQSSVANPIASPTVTTTYQASGLSVNGCVASAHLTVNVIPDSLNTIQNISIAIGQQVTLTTSGAIGYSWAPSSGLSCTNCSSPVASPTVTTTYTVTGTTGSCTFIDSVTVTVLPANALSGPGNWLWAADVPIAGEKIATDNAGNLYVSGYNNNAVLFDTISIAAGNSSILAKYSPTGQLLSAGRLSTTGNVTITCQKCDHSDNLIVAGFFGGTITVGSFTATIGAGLEGIFLLKMDPAGVPLWMQTSSGTTHIEVSDLAIDQQDNVYGAGHFQGNQTFASSTITTPGTSNFFFRYNSSGMLQWININGTSNHATERKIASDDAGAVYITGTFSGTNLTFGTYTVSLPSSSQAGFLVKIDAASGTPLLLEGFGHGLGITGLHATPSKIYIEGNMLLPNTIGPFSFPSNNNSVFLLEMDSAGNYVAANGYGAPVGGGSGGGLNSMNNELFLFAGYADNCTVAGLPLSVVHPQSTPIFSLVSMDTLRNGLWSAVAAPGIISETAASVSGYAFCAGQMYQNLSTNFGTITLPGQATTTYHRFIAAVRTVGLNDAGITAILYSGANACNTNDSILVRATNFSHDSIIGVQLHWSVNSQLQPPVYLPDTIAAGDTTAYINLGSPVFTNAGTYIIKVWTEAPNGLFDYATFNDTATMILQIGSVSAVSVNPASVSLCTGDSAILTASTNSTVSYQWRLNTSPLSSATGAQYTATLPGAYDVVVTDTLGCQLVSGIASVVVVGSPSALISAITPTAVCQGQQVLLVSLNTGVSFQWLLNGNVLSGAITDNYVPIQDGNYSLVVSVGTCSDSSSAVPVVFYPLPLVSSSASDSSFCIGNSTTLSAYGAVSYSWMPGNLSGQTVTVSPSATTSYTTTGTSADGCADIAVLTLTVNPLPAVSYNETLPLVCINWSPVTLSPGSPSGGQYSGPGVFNNMFDPSVAGIGTFAVTYLYTDTNNCSSSDTSMITVDLCTGLLPAGTDDDFRVMPNPFSDKLVIVTEEPAVAKLYNVSGLSINSWELSTGSNEISTEGLANGVYFLQLETAGKKNVKMLIRQN